MRPLGPADDLQPAVEMLHQGGAAFDPVAIVAIEDIVEPTNLGGVNVTANHAIHAATARFGDDGGFVVAYVFDRIFNLVFEISRQRPVGKTKRSACTVEPAVDSERPAVGAVADKG